MSTKEKSKKSDMAKHMPEGFEEVGRSALAGWFVRETGNSVQGVLKGSFTVKGKFGDRKVYRVEITSGTTKVSTSEDDAVNVETGTIGLDETGYLKKLGDLEDGREVFIKCLGKGKPGKGQRQGAWEFAIGAVPF